MKRTRNKRGETWEQFLARKRANEETDTREVEGVEGLAEARGGPPAEWTKKRRRRAPRHPPDFEAETAHALAYAELHCRLWKPELRDVKRLEEGKTALLLKDHRGAAVMLVVRGGKVLDVGTECEFRETKEAL